MEHNTTGGEDCKATRLASAHAIDDRLAALAPMAPDDFFRITIQGAASVLRDEANPLRLNLFSTAIRMLFEHVMGTLAPDKEVEACAWYAPVDGQSKPVRAQRIRYWLQGGLTDGFLQDELGIEPDELRKRLLKAFNGLSEHVHGRANSLVYDPAEQAVEAEATVAAVEELFYAYHDCREALLGPLVEGLDEGAVDSLLSETIQSIDELATHHSIEEIYTDRTDVVWIGPSTVRYGASGTVSVTLQWGSNSDLRRGDGAELGQSFPFECHFDVPLDDPRDLTMADIVSGVDTSSWYGHDVDESTFEEANLRADCSTDLRRKGQKQRISAHATDHELHRPLPRHALPVQPPDDDRDAILPSPVRRGATDAELPADRHPRRPVSP